MRCAVYDALAPSGIKLTTLAAPTGSSAKTFYRRGAILCDVVAAGVNPVDAKYLVGDKVPESWMGWAAGRRRSTPCRLLGRVVDAPKGYEAGDEVYGFAADPASVLRGPMKGSLAERVRAPVDQICRKPKSRARGARVVGVCSSRNVDFVAGLGADVVLDYAAGDVFDAIKQEAPFDIIFDCVSSAVARDSGAGYHAKLEGAVAAGGSYVVFGGATKDWLKAGLKRVARVNLFGSMELFWIKMPFAASALEALAALADKGELKVKVQAVLPFTDAGCREAFDTLRGRRTVGTLVVDVAGTHEAT
ncbi:oxidoreductase [Aureococcus anophagefferens]|nr:oxidoreductase [Aureococcus anophagefferens]